MTAAEVVRELGKENLSDGMWRGSFSGPVRSANNLPVGLLTGKDEGSFGVGCDGEEGEGFGRAEVCC